jgi:energy-converting hydrogenase Eha subunit G
MATTTSIAPAPARLDLNAFVAVICLLLAIALPLLVVYYLATAPAHVLAAHMGLPPASALTAPGWHMSLTQRAMVLVMGLTPVGCMAVGLMYARRCFRSFSRQEHFTLDVVRSLRGFAAAIFFSGVSALLVAPLASVLLSALSGTGHLSLTLKVESSQTLLLLFGGIAWQIAAVMAKAVALAEENSQFV